MAFFDCSGLTSIISKIQNPFVIEDDVFECSNKDIYATATLTVPKGTKAAYLATEGWNKFANIVESDGSESVQTKRTIHVAKAGTLSNYISNDEKYQIEELTLTGEINGDDLGFLREMAGKKRVTTGMRYPGFDNTEGKLKSLDFSDSKLVSGGISLYVDDPDISYEFTVTHDNEVPPRLFEGCKNLTLISIPNSVSIIGSYAFNGTAWYENQSDGLVYIGKMLYAYKGEMPTSSSVTIKEGTVGIACSAFEKCTNLVSIKIPNSVTTIGGISSWPNVEYGGVFWECSNLTSITIPSSVTFIGSSTFNGCSSLTSITIPNSVTYIGNQAFDGCKGLTSITIPNSVTSIGSNAFSGCSGLTSITIPNSVTFIGYDVFWGCGGLTSIISKIQNPFVIEDNVFYCSNKDIYATATLTVPKGTKAAYQATEGWNKFANIVEEGATDEVMFTTDGVTYQGSSSNKTAVVKSVDTKLKTLEIPASVSYNGTSYQVTGIAENAFSGCTLAALIWNADVALPSNAFSSASIGSNFLLYVKSSSYAPSSVKNIIVNGTAQTIVLSDDGGQFYCPQSFTAHSISYTHNYSMETGGSGMGWETIALPFNVQKVSHSPRGEIVPFASYGSGSNLKPFWLASMVSSGFRSSSSIQANTPYIIAMPNNSSYRNDYIMAGDVTFSAENVSVPVTPTFSGFFVPAYSTIAKSASVYALNVRNRYVTNTGNYVAGSRFISNLRDVRPFEAYISQGSSTRGVIEIDFSDGTTGMADVIGAFDADRPIDIYTLSGQKVAQAKQSEIDNILNQLPHGVYIVNGKKIVK